MSFQYPSDYAAQELPNMGYSVSITKENTEIIIEVVNNTFDDESFSIMSEGYKYSGLHKNNASGIAYKAYESNDGGLVVFLFEKDGKIFGIIGPSVDSDVMDKLIETLK